MLSHRDRNAQRIAALDERAEALGLKVGMGIADARAMHPALEVLEAEPQRTRRLLEGLADWCDRYTPLVALDGEDGLMLDITGCAHLFGGERALLDDVLSRLFQQGFEARAGLASTAGAAWAAARYGLGAVDPGGEKAALGPLPIQALRLPAEMRAGLEKVGLRQAGQVMAAPRAPLARRFGVHLISRLDQALGVAGEAISPRMPVPPLSVERPLAEPIMHMEMVEEVVATLAASLAQALERRGEGARRAGLSLYRVDGMVSRIEAGMSRPLREAAPMVRLFHERLARLGETIDTGFGFDLIRLCVFEAVPMEDAQEDLVAAPQASEGDLALLADRMEARLGSPVMMRPLLRESHLPERAVGFVPFAASATRGSAAVAASPRPVRLLERAEPISVTAEVPDGPPRHFRWRRAFHKIARVEGPERIGAEWWHDAAVPPDRDYFRVEDEAGRRFWLYREGLYGTESAAPGWYMQGLFA